MIIFLVAAIVGLAGVLGNGGSEHELTDGFAVLGIEVHGSTGTLFLIGTLVGVVATLGLAMLLAGARRTAVRGRTARRELKQSRRRTAEVSQERDDLIDQNHADREHREKGT